MRPSSVVLAPSVLIALFFAMVVAGAAPVAAQFGGIGDKLKRAQEELRKTKEASKKEEDAKKEADAKSAPPAAAASPAVSSPATGPATTPPAADAAPSFQAYGKFDFVPGERIVAVEDFTQDAIGDFPAKWNTDASGEIVTLAGLPGRWLKLTRAGFFTPEFITELPENVTVEFDLVVPPTANPGFPLVTALVQLSDLKRPTDWQTAPNNLQVTAHPSAGASGQSSIISRQDSASSAANMTSAKPLTAGKGQPVHFALWRQRQRVRVYMNEEKVWDVPRAVSASARLNSMLFFVGGGCGNCEYYLANLRVATGAADTRNKILSEGKWISHGILFDVNSDRLKPESYGSLKEIAGVLTENADLKVQIVGHTDSDGDEAANLDLSRRRAASVKTTLTNEFKIDATRMDTDGKGENQPVDKNDTPAGKANNRRVEFIKK